MPDAHQIRSDKLKGFRLISPFSIANNLVNVKALLPPQDAALLQDDYPLQNCTNRNPAYRTRF